MRRLVSSFLNFVKYILLIIGILNVIGIALAIRLAFDSSNKVATFKGPYKDKAESILYLKLQGPIQETETLTSFVQEAINSLAGKPKGPYLLELNKVLDLAQKDPDIKALFIELADLQGSLANFEALRSTLLSFNASKKPIYLWTASANHNHYFLATAADTITLAPSGELALTGPVIQSVYFAEALEKLGIEMDIVRVGRYKSAVEPFIENQPSSASKEMHEDLVMNLHNLILDGIRERRPQCQNYKQVIEHSWFTAKEAKEWGLVDQLVYLQQNKEQLSNQYQAKFVDFSSYSTLTSAQTDLLGNNKSKADGIALIKVQGQIMMEGQAEEQVASAAQIGVELDWAQEESKIKAVVIQVSSPGGSAIASDIINEKIKRLKEKKPVVVHMGSYAASGGYYISSNANRILAQAASITGSIGVFSVIPKFPGVAQKFGIHLHVFSPKENKGLLDPSVKSTPKDLEGLVRITKQIYDDFLNEVAIGRGKSKEQIESIAEGRVYTGAQAKALGLIDDIGSLKDAITAAKELVNLPKEVPLYQWQPNELNFKDCLTNIDRCIPLRATVQNKSILEKRILQITSWVKHLELEPVQAIWLPAL